MNIDMKIVITNPDNYEKDLERQQIKINEYVGLCH